MRFLYGVGDCKSRVADSAGHEITQKTKKAGTPAYFVSCTVVLLKRVVLILPVHASGCGSIFMDGRTVRFSRIDGRTLFELAARTTFAGAGL